MRHILVGAAAVCTIFAGVQANAQTIEIEQAAKLGEVNFQRCVACHLVDGSGIPGAFPKLKGRLASIVQLDGGRDYLTMVVSSGLTGPITVAGSQYMGVMPAQSYGLMTSKLPPY